MNPKGTKAIRQAVCPGILRKEVRDMPITITFHVFGFTVTVRIKGRNRHSAK